MVAGFCQRKYFNTSLLFFLCVISGPILNKEEHYQSKGENE
jgi:hypothetical protein